jgi:hypothetical protein
MTEWRRDHARAATRRCGLVVAIALAVSATFGLGGAAALSVSPQAFTKKVCAAAAAVYKAGRPVTKGITTASHAYTAAPSAETAAGLRDALVTSFNTFDQQGATLIAAIQSAGTPTSKNGGAFVAAMISQVQTLRDESTNQATQFQAVDVSSSSAFAASIQQISDEIKRDSDAFRASARARREFADAPAALRPLVTLLTTSGNTCKKH